MVWPQSDRERHDTSEPEPFKPFFSRQAQRLRRGADVRPHAVLTRLLLCGNPLGDAGAELLCDAAASPYRWAGNAGG